ncbi:MAG TPA: HAD-IC family P-type ATPase [Micromonosporaceae bacterium]|jgi:cation-transporting ATPase E|nr:HAD-IC family P-type ATPase [Micromonosporaceae bacterium]
MDGTGFDRGLSAAEVAERMARGLANVSAQQHSRTLAQILRANVLTRFNAIIGVLCALVLVFGDPIDALFGLIIVVNSAVGVVQELRAKQTLDRLAVLGEAPVRVRRDGAEIPIRPRDVVVDDLVLLAAGETVPVDGVLRTAEGLEIDESLLTGEADHVPKQPGDDVRSGSFAAVGTGAFTATGVGSQAYAARLVADASRFDLAHSELRAGIDRFLKLITWVIIPVAALLVVRQFTSGESVPDAVVGSVAGVVPMIPEGLVLMTSVAFAVGVIRLGRRNCLVQELPAVEVLARVDTLCVDKTGTLTEPGMRLREIRPSAGAEPQTVTAALAALLAADRSPNPTMRAIAAGLDPTADRGWRAVQTLPFSSARKYSGAAFDGNGSWLLGAPDVLLGTDDPARDEAQRLGGQGLRVLALARTSTLDGDDREAAALVVLEQRLRPSASRTVRYFAAQDVGVKVISGDNAVSVGAIAGQVGVPGAEDPVDARSLPEGTAELAEVLAGHSVFGRVTPEQKRAFVGALHSRGHTVAMTGDGVNDVLALKDADLGIAMGSGSGATRAVAKVVLLDDDFAGLPRVLAEGRRVLANIERVANLFLTKTVYSVLLAILVGLAHLPFPYLPRHITLVGTLTIGVPGFFLALAPSNERARPGFVPRVLRFAIPAGLVCGLAAFAAYAIARANTGSDLAADRSTATLTLFLASFFALALVARPWTRWRLGLLIAMGAAFAMVAAIPAAARVAALTFTDPRNDAIGVGLAAAASAILVVLLRRTHWLGS